MQRSAKGKARLLIQGFPTSTESKMVSLLCSRLFLGSTEPAFFPSSYCILINMQDWQKMTKQKEGGV